MILSLYFPESKEINTLRAQNGYGFMKMNAWVASARQPVPKNVFTIF